MPYRPTGRTLANRGRLAVDAVAQASRGRFSTLTVVPPTPPDPTHAFTSRTVMLGRTWITTRSNNRLTSETT